MSDVELHELSPDEEPILSALFELYRYDFSEFTGEDVDAAGRFDDGGRVQKYASDASFRPFLIRVDGQLAGLAVVRRCEAADSSGDVVDMEQFFVMRKYRRQRIGEKMAVILFERFPGRWQVRERHDNVPAQQFWRTIIGRYAGRFDEIPADTSPTGGPIQYFTSPPSSGRIRRG